MEELQFTIEDAQIAELLGRQNYNSKNSAIFELVKNSYDSGSSICNIYIKKNYIKIEDFGCGMNDREIKEHWMHIGKSSKAELEEFEGRVPTGSKGVGRFALARLGDSIKVSTKKIDGDFWVWETNWEISTLSKQNQSFEKGTVIEILGLRDNWRDKDVLNLETFLSRVSKTLKMTISIYYEEKPEKKIENIFINNVLGKHYVSKINLAYTSSDSILKIEVESDEFQEEVRNFIGDISEKKYSDKFIMLDEFSKKSNEISFLLKELGDFNADLFFVLKPIKADIKKFKYKYSLESPSTGIILYRNDFSIVSFDGSKDWLDLESRARKSPAAASHLTGSWRVRGNQIYGMVDIDKNRNKHIRDISNRQGIEEDEYFETFKEIINFGISRFEKYRQSIIRKIDEHNKLLLNNNKEKELVKTFLQRPQDVTQMSKKEIIDLATEIKDIQNEAKQQSKARVESEKQHKYDVRILNVLATQGLRASAIGHELYNKRSKLASGFKDIEEALKEYGFWNELISEEYTQLEYMNVPSILRELDEVSLKLISFIDVILKKIEKQKFKLVFDDIEMVLEGIFGSWETQYNWIEYKIIFVGEMPNKYKITKDVIEVIFDNLILNSIQHNEMKNQMLLELTIDYDGEYLNFTYKDNGVGLSDKYKNDPMRILDVHESSREDGHGLGMWILNNTLNMYSGKVKEIKSENGFEFKFYLKG